MGAALNTAGAAEIAAELACCACSSVCGFICKDPATRAKLRYCTLLFIATTMCFVILMPGMRRNFDRIPKLCGKTVTRETCDMFFGFGAVYRIMLSMTCFYGSLAIFTFRITRVKSFRARFNNGCWIVKIILLLCITVASFFIPKKLDFFRIWMYACLIGGFIFMLYQIMLIIDLGHSWSVSWAERLETNNTKIWYTAMVLATLLMFLVSMAAVSCFYYFFAGSLSLTKCKANMFYITFIVIQCFLATIVSVTPTVQQELEGAGLLQCSVVVLYTAYLTWNTLSSEPDSICNPVGKVILDYDTLSGIDGEALFGCVLTFALIIFACTVRTHTSLLGKHGLALSEGEDYAIATFLSEQGKKKKPNDRADESEISLDDFVGYSYSLFHVIMALASLHVLMILTNWHSPHQSSNMRKLVKNWASVWVQMAASFICVLIYIWFLVTPLVKKIWGPLFGITTPDVNGRGHSRKAQRSKVEEKVELKHMQTQNDKADSHIIDTKCKNEANEKQQKSNLQRFKSVESIKSAFSAISRVRSRNKGREHVNKSTDQSQESLLTDVSAGKNKKSERRSESKLKRFKSIESLKSGFSAISNATSRVKKKLKKKLQNHNKLNQLREMKTGGDENIASKAEISHDNTEMSEKLMSRRNSAVSTDNVQINSNHVTNTNHINMDDSREKTQEEIKRYSMIVEENQQVLQQNEASLTHSSLLIAETQKRKTQDPAVAREILKLQWKILRMQAKVVKVQERIIRIQAENEFMQKNEQEAMNRTDLPIAQSSTVAGPVYSRRMGGVLDFSRTETQGFDRQETQVIRRKENG